MNTLILKTLQQAKRLIVIVVGSTVLMMGIAMIVLPGPAVLVVPIGLGVLATELVWARRLLNKLKSTFQKGKEKNLETEYEPGTLGSERLVYRKRPYHSGIRRLLRSWITVTAVIFYLAANDITEPVPSILLGIPGSRSSASHRLGRLSDGTKSPGRCCTRSQLCRGLGWRNYRCPRSLSYPSVITGAIACISPSGCSAFTSLFLEACFSICFSMEKPDRE
jgi:hypothetical protein